VAVSGAAEMLIGGHLTGMAAFVAVLAAVLVAWHAEEPQEA
jgi:hypothetical protein